MGVRFSRNLVRWIDTVRILALAFLVFVFVLSARGHALAEDAAASPSPAPTAAPRRLTLAAHGSIGIVNTQTVGPGVVPFEATNPAPGFVGGSPLSPGTPYDFWTNAPLTTGFGSTQSLIVT